MDYGWFALVDAYIGGVTIGETYGVIRMGGVVFIDFFEEAV